MKNNSIVIKSKVNGEIKEEEYCLTDFYSLFEFIDEVTEYITKLYEEGEENGDLE